MNLGQISSVFSYPIVQGKPAYLSTILSLQSEREIAGSSVRHSDSMRPRRGYAGQSLSRRASPIASLLTVIATNG